MPPKKTYLIRVSFNGKRYSKRVKAHTEQEAKEHVAKFFQILSIEEI